MEPKRFLVKIEIVGDELVVPLPQEIRQELGLQDGDELDMQIEPGKIILTPCPRPPAEPVP